MFSKCSAMFLHCFVMFGIFMGESDYYLLIFFNDMKLGSNI